MKIARILLAPLALTVALATPAHAGFSVAGVGLLNLSSLSTDQTLTAGTSINMGTSAGFGVLVGTSLMPGFGIEVGALLSPRKSSIDFNGTNVSTTSFKSLEVPVLVRFNLLPIVSFGAGAYYARGMGSVTTSTTGAETSLDFSAANANANEFGVAIAGGAGIPILPFFSIIVDARYLIALTDTDTTATTARYKTFQLLGGVRFEL